MVLRIAHRGFSSEAPENSIEAFKKAAESGSDMVEFDVHETKDGHLVVMHDKTLNRTTDGKGSIKNITLDELRKFHGPNGEHVPTIEEVIRILKNKCAMNIELKDKQLTNKLLKIIKKEKIEKKVIISSVYTKVIKTIKEKELGIKTAWLVSETRWQLIILYILRFFLPYFLVRMAKKMKTDAIGLQYKLVTDKLVKALHQNHINIGVWTVNNKEDIKKMQLLGVDAIISDKPGLLTDKFK